MNPYLLALLARSAAATGMTRTGWKQAALWYMSKKHPKLDPYVMPLIGGVNALDKAAMGPIDYAQRYAKYLDLPPQR